MINSDPVLGYRRPAMLGGAANSDPDALTIRLYGTPNYELNFRDRVVLLDTFYDRGPRLRGLGFRPAGVTRGDPGGTAARRAGGDPSARGGHAHPRRTGPGQDHQRDRPRPGRRARVP